ncbi:uncharacterized protein [Melanerpes formicivorus]|uniref:uncharacterized protein n=1 Tax=Melanerpes formicivorus TaxID=211600 RepID=UPI003590146F
MPSTACAQGVGGRQRKRGPGSCCCAAPVLLRAPTGAAPSWRTARPCGSAMDVLAPATPPVPPCRRLVPAPPGSPLRHPPVPLRLLRAAPALLGPCGCGIAAACSAVPRIPTAAQADAPPLPARSSLLPAQPASCPRSLPPPPQAWRAAAAKAALGPSGCGKGPARAAGHKHLTGGPATAAGGGDIASRVLETCGTRAQPGEATSGQEEHRLLAGCCRNLSPSPSMEQVTRGRKRATAAKNVQTLRSPSLLLAPAWEVVEDQGHLPESLLEAEASPAGVDTVVSHRARGRLRWGQRVMASAVTGGAEGLPHLSQVLGAGESPAALRPCAGHLQGAVRAHERRSSSSSWAPWWDGWGLGPGTAWPLPSRQCGSALAPFTKGKATRMGDGPGIRRPAGEAQPVRCPALPVPRGQGAGRGRGVSSQGCALECLRGALSGPGLEEQGVRRRALLDSRLLPSLCPHSHEPLCFPRPWQLLLCSSCAAEGTHRCCSQLEDSTALWECHGCAGPSNASSATLQEAGPSTPRQPTQASSRASEAAEGCSSPSGPMRLRDRSRLQRRAQNPYSRPGRRSSAASSELAAPSTASELPSEPSSPAPSLESSSRQSRPGPQRLRERSCPRRGAQAPYRRPSHRRRRR